MSCRYFSGRQPLHPLACRIQPLEQIGPARRSIVKAKGVCHMTHALQLKCVRKAFQGHVAVKGLMAIPPPVREADEARPYFRGLRELAVRLTQQGIPRISMAELSMGMSNDFVVAVEEGATFVRVGTAIFGARHG